MFRPVQCQTMDCLLGSRFGSGESGDGSRRMYLPINLTESETGYAIEAPVAGFKPEEIDVTFQDGLLSIKAEHKQEQPSEQGQTLRREFVWGDSVRQVSLPGEVHSEKTEASEHGLLRVSVPKPAKAQPRRVPIGGRGATPRLSTTT